MSRTIQRVSRAFKRIPRDFSSEPFRMFQAASVGSVGRYMWLSGFQNPSIVFHRVAVAIQGISDDFNGPSKKFQGVSGLFQEISRAFQEVS